MRYVGSQPKCIHFRKLTSMLLNDNKPQLIHKKIKHYNYIMPMKCTTLLFQNMRYIVDYGVAKTTDIYVN